MLRDVVGMIGFQVHVLLGVEHHVKGHQFNEGFGQQCHVMKRFDLVCLVYTTQIRSAL